jgi:hypothetical protein
MPSQLCRVLLLVDLSAYSTYRFIETLVVHGSRDQRCDKLNFQVPSACWLYHTFRDENQGLAAGIACKAAQPLQPQKITMRADGLLSLAMIVSAMMITDRDNGFVGVCCDRKSGICFGLLGESDEINDCVLTCTQRELSCCNQQSGMLTEPLPLVLRAN